MAGELRIPLAGDDEVNVSLEGAMMAMPTGVDARDPNSFGTITGIAGSVPDSVVRYQTRLAFPLPRNWRVRGIGVLRGEQILEGERRGSRPALSIPRQTGGFYEVLLGVEGQL